MALFAAGRTISATRGDAMDAGRLFEEHSARIYGYCVARLGSRTDAEDAVQTTFLYAHRALQRGVLPTSQSAWLLAIAKNVCRAQRRTISRRGFLSSDREMDSVAGPQEVGGEDSELLLGLREALASIPETQRRALVLREWHGMSAPEVASELGMSSAAAHALLTRARRSLAKALTTVPRRPVLGLDLGSLLAQLRALFAGTAAKGVTAVVVVGVAIGGASVERALGDHPATPRAPAALGTADRSTSERWGVASTPAGDNVFAVSTAVGRHGRATIASDPESPSPGGTGGGAGPQAPIPPTVEEGGAPGGAGSGDGGSAGAGGGLLPGVPLPSLPPPDVGLPTVDLPVPDTTLPVPDTTLPKPDTTLPPTSVPEPPDNGLPPAPASVPVPSVGLP